MNIEKKQIQRLAGIVLWAAIAFFAALLVPQVRDFLIQAAEKLLGRSLTHQVWHARLVKWGFELILLDALALIALSLLRRTIFAEPKISVGSFVHEKLSALDFDERLHIAAMFVFTVVFLRFNAFVSPTTGDPHSYATALQEHTLLEFLKIRHYLWSSRLLIEALMVNIYRWDGILWRILNTICLVTVAECTIRIALPKNKRRYSFLVYALLFLIPQHSLSDAGWGPTTTNYLWPLAAALPAFVVIKKQFLSEHISKAETAASLLLCVFAANQEQLAALMFGLLLVLLIYRIAKNKKFSRGDFYIVAILVICAISIAYMFVCPGNFKRRETEISHWIPPYSTYSFFDKIQIGLMTILTYYFTERHLNFIILPLCAILTFIASKKSKKLFLFQSAIDFLIAFLTFVGLYIKIQKGKFFFSNVLLARFTEYSQASVLLQVFILSAIFALLLISVFAASKTQTAGFLNVLILCAGFCSALILAFSPTVYSSGTRCYLFFTESIFIVASRFFAQEEKLHFLEKTA